MLALDAVKVNIRSLKILRQVSLKVAPGQVVGLVGRNGAGKTTTIKSVVGLMNVAAGTIQFNGGDLLDVPTHGRAALGIGYLPEDRRMLAMSTEENILLPAWASRLPDASARLELIYSHMPEVKAFAKRSATQLSGGQQKLTALARALMSGTRLLLLDEPFEGLAPAMSHKVSQVIQAFQRQGVSALVAESDLKLIQHLTQRVYTIERGQIVSETD